MSANVSREISIEGLDDQGEDIFMDSAGVEEIRADPFNNTIYRLESDEDTQDGFPGRSSVVMKAPKEEQATHSKTNTRSEE